MIVLPRTAMVLAAGLGTRLRPVTETIPKPLIEINGRSLLDHAIDRLTLVGVERVVVNVHYKAAMVVSQLARRDHPRIEISHETELLDTGGGVARALPLLDDTFFVVNSDVFWLDGKDRALQRLAAAFDPERMDAVLLLQRTATAVGYEGSGDYLIDPSGRHIAAASVRSPPFCSAASSCCTVAPSAAFPTAFSRWSGFSTVPTRRGACRRSCMMASGITSGRRKASPPPANGCRRIASSGS